EERQSRLGPGGLDPVEVMESLPEHNISLLAKARQPPGGLRCNPPGLTTQTLLASLAT
ncbi:hypothetical protein AVEN_90897-1, partial [Araneus ventricosus]